MERNKFYCSNCKQNYINNTEDSLIYCENCGFVFQENEIRLESESNYINDNSETNVTKGIRRDFLTNSTLEKNYCVKTEETKKKNYFI
jgi:transcription initiation factor TFIIIB Brf1 subunit/transcription initiation factor TFIIB